MRLPRIREESATNSAGATRIAESEAFTRHQRRRKIAGETPIVGGNVTGEATATGEPVTGNRPRLPTRGRTNCAPPKCTEKVTPPSPILSPHNAPSADTPSISNWEDDDDVTPPKKSAWDLPTPRSSSGREYDRSDRKSHRSFRDDRSMRRHSKETPLPTPSYKYNDWMGDKRKHIKYTPRNKEGSGTAITPGLSQLLIISFQKPVGVVLILMTKQPAQSGRKSRRGWTGSGTAWMRATTTPTTPSPTRHERTRKRKRKN